MPARPASRQELLELLSHACSTCCGRCCTCGGKWAYLSPCMRTLDCACAKRSRWVGFWLPLPCFHPFLASISTNAGCHPLSKTVGRVSISCCTCSPLTPDTCVLWRFSDVLQDSIVTGAWLPDDSKLLRLDPAVEAELALFTQNGAPLVYVSFAGLAAVSRKMLGCVMLALQRLRFSAILDGLLSCLVSATCRVARMMHRVWSVEVAN